MIRTIWKMRFSVFRIHPNICIFNRNFFRLFFCILRIRIAFLSREHHTNLSRPLSELQQSQLDLPRSIHKATTTPSLPSWRPIACKAKSFFKKLSNIFADAAQLPICNHMSTLSEHFPSLQRRQGSSLSRQPYTQVGQQEFAVDLNTSSTAFSLR